MITEEMKNLIAVHNLGYVGTVNDDGTPNVSPKGTMVVIDETTLVFGDVRSPRTVANVQKRPALEINFSDIFRRICLKLVGKATVIGKDHADFDTLIKHFAHWEEEGLSARVRNIVLMKVTKAQKIWSPSYDLGATEAELVASMKKVYEI